VLCPPHCEDGVYALLAVVYIHLGMSTVRCYLATEQSSTQAGHASSNGSTICFPRGFSPPPMRLYESVLPQWRNAGTS
jgi:hypothetical protein